MTFRLDENLITTLRWESERQHISLNSMVNQIIQRFVEWDMYESKLGMVSFLKSVAIELLKKEHARSDSTSNGYRQECYKRCCYIYEE